MSEHTFLRKEVESIFQEALQATKNQVELENFHRLIEQCHERLNRPMRVAIVGLIKAGKSTLLNALMGQLLVATGRTEATFNINWLKYGSQPSLKVHFKDDRIVEDKSFEELATLTLRSRKNQEYLLSIKHIEVFYPNDILKIFNIIDTPGLKSFYQDDSENTHDFLRLYGQELTEVTKQEASKADAVLYLFSRPPTTADQEVVEQFQGALRGDITPLNAIGVLTQVDRYWSDSNISDPMTAGKKLAKKWADHPKIKQRLYAVYPICGLIAEGAQDLNYDEFNALTKLARLPSVRLEKLLRNVKRFGRDYDDIPVTGEQRTHLVNQLGQYGVWLACDFIRAGCTERELLVEELLMSSGLEELRNLIRSHFGNRAFLIKLSTILQQISTAYFQERYSLKGDSLKILEKVAGNFDALKCREHSFQELNILQNYYRQKLDFDEVEKKQLLEVTGEYGTNLEELLGICDSSKTFDLLLIVKERILYWKQRASDVIGTDRETITAAKVIARSYELILYRIQKEMKE